MNSAGCARRSTEQQKKAKTQNGVTWASGPHQHAFVERRVRATTTSQAFQAEFAAESASSPKKAKLAYVVAELSCGSTHAFARTHGGFLYGAPAQGYRELPKKGRPKPPSLGVPGMTKPAPTPRLGLRLDGTARLCRRAFMREVYSLSGLQGIWG